LLTRQSQQKHNNILTSLREWQGNLSCMHVGLPYAADLVDGFVIVFFVVVVIVIVVCAVVSMCWWQTWDHSVSPATFSK